MRKIKKSAMKSIKAGADPVLVECICVLMDHGWDYNDARIFCEDLLEEPV